MSIKKVFLSDVHMSTWIHKNQSNSHDYRWLSDIDAGEFSKCLNYLCGKDEYNEIVLLGDMFDNWVCPINEMPPSMNDIFEDPCNSAVIASLQGIAKKTTYFTGNHDMQVTKKDITTLFPGMKWGVSVYYDNRLVAEHGHGHAMFNKQDYEDDHVESLPLGYFISRVMATKAAKTGSDSISYIKHVNEIFKFLVDKSKIPIGVFDAVVEEAQLKPEDEIFMRDRSSIKVGEVREKYDSLYNNWLIKTSPHETLLSIIAETTLFGGLGASADYISKKDGMQIVIFGHSHIPELSRINYNKSVYANTGTWCKKTFQEDYYISKPYNLVITEEFDDKYIVKLCCWESDKTDPIFVEYVESIDK
ncbi:MAG: hypothetical protein HQK95_09170 [Nitrospirae bacterium]|nr:hypothetical protein [Nitrospirota bacterium]